MISRRRMLAAAAAFCGSAVGGAAMPWPQAPPAAAEDGRRSIALDNVQTGERLEIEYFRGGRYAPDALAAIEVLLRDFRNGERHAIDPKLLDYLVDVAALIEVPAAYSVVSGYRSPQTHERLHERGGGVPRRSLHTQGRAVDVRMSGVDCRDLAARAAYLKRGGVGYYRASNFLHLDTGAFRTWRG